MKPVPLGNPAQRIEVATPPAQATPSRRVILAALVTLRLGVKAERRPLEEVAPPLSMRVELAEPPEKR